MKRAAGFALVELLIVIVIIGLIASIAIPEMLKYVGDAKLAAAKSDIRTVRDAIVMRTAELERPLANLGELGEPLATQAQGRFDYRLAQGQPVDQGFRGAEPPPDRWAPPGVAVYGWEARTVGEEICHRCLNEKGGRGVGFLFVTGGGGPITQGGAAGPSPSLGGSGGDSGPVVDPCKLSLPPDWCEL